MKNFKDIHNNFYSNLKIDKNKEIEILNNIENKKIIHKVLKPITVTLILLVAFVGITFGKDIINSIKSMYVIHERKDASSTCIITNSVIDINNNAYKELSIKKENNIGELNQILNVDLLKNDVIENTNFNILKMKAIDDKLAYLQVVSKDIKMKPEVYNQYGENTAKIELSISFLTNDSSQEMRKVNSAFESNEYNWEDDYVNAFEASNCNEEHLDKYHIKSLDIDLYFWNIYDYSIIERDLVYNRFDQTPNAFFKYNGILYNITGEMVSRNTIIDFIETLK